MMKKICNAMLVGGALVALSAHADGDAARGKKVFEECAACHSLEKGVNGVGPTLSESMLNPRPLNMPAMRVSTPNLFSTRTDSVWRMARKGGEGGGRGSTLQAKTTVRSLRQSPPGPF